MSLNETKQAHENKFALSAKTQPQVINFTWGFSFDIWLFYHPVYHPENGTSRWEAVAIKYTGVLRNKPSTLELSRRAPKVRRVGGRSPVIKKGAQHGSG